MTKQNMTPSKSKAETNINESDTDVFESIYTTIYQIYKNL